MGAELSVVICGQLYESRKDLCQEHGCNQALLAKEKIKVLKLFSEESLGASYSSLMKKIQKEDEDEDETQEDYLGE